MQDCKAKVEELRDLISSGELTITFEKLKQLASNDLSKDVQLLNFQFNDWTRREYLNLENEVITRNRIVYALLDIISKVEASCTRRWKYIPLYRAKIEQKIRIRYGQLEELYQNEDQVDLLLNLLLQLHTDSFARILELSQESGNRTKIFPRIKKLIKTSLSSKVKEESFASTLEEVQHRFLEKEAFFEDWLSKELSKEKEIKKLKLELKEYKKRYKKILVGGIFTSILIAFYSILNIDVEISLKGEPEEDENLEEIFEI